MYLYATYIPFNQLYIGWVLSSFFYGYIITQLPGGWLATKFGGKYVFGVGVLVTSLLTLITPQMAYLNVWALVACRVVIGAFEVSNVGTLCNLLRLIARV